MALEVRDDFNMTTNLYQFYCKKCECMRMFKDCKSDEPPKFYECTVCGKIMSEKQIYKNGLEQQEYSEQKKREEENLSEKPVFDVVQKPYHYNVGIEVYAYIKSWKMGYEAGNIIKYVTRYPYKDSKKRVQDLEKAKWYLERLIEVEKEKEEGEQNDSK